MKTYIFLTILLQIFVLQVRANKCELTFNDGIKFTENEVIQSRRLCNTSDFLKTNAHRISIAGRLVDYTTRCQKSISNANIEIIRLHSNRLSMCSDLYHPNTHGYFNLTDVIVHFNKEVFLRVTALGYKTIYKKIPLPSSYERLEEMILNWQIGLTTDIESSQLQPDERMKSVVDTLLSEMTLDEKIGQLNLEGIGFNADGPIISDEQRERILEGGWVWVWVLMT